LAMRSAAALWEVAVHEPPPEFGLDKSSAAA
jgi:hypothetical protein